MDKLLLNNIVRHILENLLILQSDIIDKSITKSLISNDFLLEDKITITLDDGVVLKKNVWGCQLSANDNELKLIYADCSQEPDITEYCLFVQLQDAPGYGLYYVADNDNVESLLSCSINTSESTVGWLDCNTFLQATFLAGMEQIKDINFVWNKCSNYKQQFESLLSFIRYHDSINEDNNEGQEIGS